jgi:hypothetical protein
MRDEVYVATGIRKEKMREEVERVVGFIREKVFTILFHKKIEPYKNLIDWTTSTSVVSTSAILFCMTATLIWL